MRKLSHVRVLQKALRGLLVQKKQCENGENCLYQKGRAHCAIGWAMVGLISKRSQSWEAQNGVFNFIENYHDVNSVFGHLDRSFLDEVSFYGHDGLSRAKFVEKVKIHIGKGSRLWKKALLLDEKIK